MAPKYQPLERHLRSLRADRETVMLSMAQMEEIIGSNLPRSAYTYREWWSNVSASTRMK